MAKETKTGSLDLDLMKEEMEAVKAEIIAQAKEEAAQIVANAKAKAGGELTEEQKRKAEKEHEYYNELVEVELFKDNGKYKDDIFVAVNGVGCIVPRGKPVKIKRKYALAIEDSMRQDRKTSEFLEMKVRELQDAESKI